MNKMQRIFGTSFFVIGLFLFIISLTLSNYQLTSQIIDQQGSGGKFDILHQTASSILDKRYSSNINFISNLRQAFRNANQVVREKYGISTNVVEQIIAKAPEKGAFEFHQQWIKDVISGKGEVIEFQQKNLMDYTSWMEGKKFGSKQDLQSQFQKTVNDINNNIQNQLGFDNYSIDNLTFEITKEASLGFLPNNALMWFFLSFGLMSLGGILFFLGLYHGKHPGIKNDHVYHKSISARGWLGIATGFLLISFYIILYFWPEYLTNWVILVDPLSEWLKNQPASQWFLYGFLYSLAVLVMGVKMIMKYRHSRYHIIRTCSVIFFQLALAFIIPEILVSLHKPGYDFKNIWPLDYDFFYSYNLNELISSGALGWFMLIWGIALIIIAVPVFTYFLGKRWYCSWVCGCGGLAETAGDPFRQLSDKSLKAWRIERWLIHSILVFAVINTAGVLYTYFSGSYSLFGISTETIKSSYGFLISSIFSGVVGVGFYPLMGNRVWCRFGCPLAAYLGIIQRFKSRFRITTNGGQCISCGNCSAYCEMGIDVRWYAQRGQNIVRSSCVGCGVCASVCPRGVLRLENGTEKGRINGPYLVGNENLKMPEIINSVPEN